MKQRWITLAMTLMMLLAAAPTLVAQEATSSEDESVIAIRKKYFLKAKRYEFGFHGGVIPNDPFVTGMVVGGSLGYHFTESFFMEVPVGFVFNDDRDATDFLQNNLGVAPDLDDINWYSELHFGWSPVYGKLSFMGKKIFYFDMSVYAGPGITNSRVSDFGPHGVVGIAQRFILNKYMALRLDAKNALEYRDDTGVSSAWRNVVYITLGLNFFLPLR